MKHSTHNEEEDEEASMDALGLSSLRSGIEQIVAHPIENTL
jgi:hypothetical protein